MRYGFGWWESWCVTDYPEEISSVWNHTISLGQIYSKYAIYIFQKGILDFDQDRLGLQNILNCSGDMISLLEAWGWLQSTEDCLYGWISGWMVQKGPWVEGGQTMLLLMASLIIIYQNGIQIIFWLKF